MASLDAGCEFIGKGISGHCVTAGLAQWLGGNAGWVGNSGKSSLE